MPAESIVSEGRPEGRRAVAGWCLYDWAMSAFNTVIGTFVFSVYVTKAVAADPESGTAAWGLMLGLSGIAIAILSPVLGAIADRGGRVKPWLGGFTAVTIIGSALLWTVTPSPSSLLTALIIVGIASTAFELANVFYNALLTRVAPAGRLGRVSGWGWGIGYFGGLGALVLCLTLLIQTETPLFGWLSKEESAHIRATGPLVAIWFALFALPLFLWVPDRPALPGRTISTAIADGLRSLRQTLMKARRHANTLRFMAASALWRDGIGTITAFGGIFAASLFGMETAQVILFAILLNITAGLGAIGFGWVDDRAGARPTLVISLIGLMLSGGCMLLVGTPAWGWAGHPGLPLASFNGDQQWLLLFGMALGVFFGPAQAASRSMMARLAPPGLETEFFGLYALSGRAVGFIGPFAYGAATVAFDSQRAGMVTVLTLFLAGLLLLFTVRDQDRAG